MKFHVPINVPEEGGSITMHIVDTGTFNARTNKKKLMAYFEVQGVPKNRLKFVMKAMGFWGTGLSEPNIVRT